MPVGNVHGLHGVPDLFALEQDPALLAITPLVATTWAVWPVLFSTAQGVRRIDPMWFKVAKNLGADGIMMLRRVIMPAIGQDIFAGIRLAVGVAWIVLVPAEYLGVTSGLGYAINDARDTLEYDTLAAMVVVIGVIGFAVKNRHQPVVSGAEEMVGAVGEALEDFDEGHGRIRVHSESWEAQSDRPVRAGQRVRVVAMDNVGNGILTLDVFNGFIHIFIEMRPKQLLAHVFFPAALYANYAEFVVDLLDGLSVVFGYGFVAN